MILETKRLILRPINLNDKNEILEYRSDRETNKYQGCIPETIDDVVIFIGKIAKEINEPETWFQFVIKLFPAAPDVGHKFRKNIF